MLLFVVVERNVKLPIFSYVNKFYSRSKKTQPLKIIDTLIENSATGVIFALRRAPAYETLNCDCLAKL